MFWISSQSVKPVNLEVGEHRDIESENYYIDLFVYYINILITYGNKKCQKKKNTVCEMDHCYTEFSVVFYVDYANSLFYNN